MDLYSFQTCFVVGFLFGRDCICFDLDIDCFIIFKCDFMNRCDIFIL